MAVDVGWCVCASVFLQHIPSPVAPPALLSVVGLARSARASGRCRPTLARTPKVCLGPPLAATPPPRSSPTAARSTAVPSSWAAAATRGRGAGVGMAVAGAGVGMRAGVGMVGVGVGMVGAEPVHREPDAWSSSGKFHNKGVTRITRRGHYLCCGAKSRSRAVFVQSHERPDHTSQLVGYICKVF